MMWIVVVQCVLLLVLSLVAWLLWVGIELHRTELREMFTAIFEHQRKVIDTLEAILSETPITRQKARRIRARILELKKQGKLMELLGAQQQEEPSEVSDAAPS